MFTSLLIGLFTSLLICLHLCLLVCLHLCLFACLHLCWLLVYISVVYTSLLIGFNLFTSPLLVGLFTSPPLLVCLHLPACWFVYISPLLVCLHLPPCWFVYISPLVGLFTSPRLLVCLHLPACWFVYSYSKIIMSNQSCHGTLSGHNNYLHPSLRGLVPLYNVLQ